MVVIITIMVNNYYCLSFEDTFRKTRCLQLIVMPLFLDSLFQGFLTW